MEEARHHTNVIPISDVSGFPLPVLVYESALLCGTEDRRTELQGWLRPKAIHCLLSCPPLEDLAHWSQWDEVFARFHGPMKEFVLQHVGKDAGLCVLETEPGVFVRVDPVSSDDALFDAVASGDAAMTASQIVSMLVRSGNVRQAPLALHATTIRTALEKLSASVAPVGDESGEADFSALLPEADRYALHDHPAVDFVLACLLRIPFRLCAAVAQEVALEIFFCLPASQYFLLASS